MELQDLSEFIPVAGETNLEGINFISNGEQYLTFCLDSEQYGVDILSVKEIRGWELPTLIPNSPHYVKGVINIRGMIIPIIDLRIRFGIGKIDYTPATVVIVLSVENAERQYMMGFVVDAVSDVLNAEGEDIKPAPFVAGSIPRDLVKGLVNVQNDAVTLLNVEQLLTLEEVNG